MTNIMRSYFVGLAAAVLAISAGAKVAQSTSTKRMTVATKTWQHIGYLRRARNGDNDHAMVVMTEPHVERK